MCVGLVLRAFDTVAVQKVSMMKPVAQTVCCCADAPGGVRRRSAESMCRGRGRGSVARLSLPANITTADCLLQGLAAPRQPPSQGEKDHALAHQPPHRSTLPSIPQHGGYAQWTQTRKALAPRPPHQAAPHCTYTTPTHAHSTHHTHTLSAYRVPLPGIYTQSSWR